MALKYCQLLLLQGIFSKCQNMKDLPLVCNCFSFLINVDSKRGKVTKSKRSKDHSALQASENCREISSQLLDISTKINPHLISPRNLKEAFRKLHPSFIMKRNEGMKKEMSSCRLRFLSNFTVSIFKLLFRERLRHEKILSSLAGNITTSHTIYPSFGRAEFFEFVLRNPYSTDQNVTIHCDDRELRYVNIRQGC